MISQEAKKRIEKLKKEIDHHRYLYHVLDKEEISGAALDSLKNELDRLERQFPEFITPDSPTQRVGGRPLDKFEKTKHSKPMMSMFDAFSRKDMEEWVVRINKIIESPLGGSLRGGFYCELKLDGLASVLVYEKGKFILGATRGDGLIGENVTQNLKTIESIPLNLRVPNPEELKSMGLDLKTQQKILKVIAEERMEVRGEAIMPKKVFLELNKKYEKEGKPTLANPRNGAAGSIRQLDPKLAASRRLEYIVWQVATDVDLKFQEQEHQLASLMGFKIIKQNKVCANLKEVFEFHDYWEKHRESLPFHIDGIVVKVNNLVFWPTLGTVGKGPRYMMAYKFSAQQATTRLKKVIWQVGRTGVLTPVAVLDPVLIGGVTVTHATLHNMDEIGRLGIKIGDTVILERAGDVIPKVIKALPKLRIGSEKNINPPQKCPICGSRIIRVPAEVAYKCINKKCYAVNLRNLTHWASKGAVDIEGLGPKITKQLMDAGLVTDIADFYSLNKGDLIVLERFAEKSAENLITSLNSNKTIPLERFIFGLGIAHVGEEMANELAQKCASFFGLRKSVDIISISQLRDYFQSLSIEELEKFKDIGPKVAESITNWFNDKHNLNLLEKLQEKSGIKIKLPPLKSGTSLKLNGKTFVLTGTLKDLTRDEAKAKIRELGGEISSAVSPKTDFVIAGENPGSKYEKAKKYKVKIINEDEFYALIKR